MNKRFISLFVVSAFFLWIVPLGAFIDQSKEKELCFGKRAICLCSQMVAKVHEMNRIGMLKSGHGGVSQESAGSQAVSPKFIYRDVLSLLTRESSFSLFQITSFYSYLHSKRIDHIPKV